MANLAVKFTGQYKTPEIRKKILWFWVVEHGKVLNLSTQTLTVPLDFKKFTFSPAKNVAVTLEQHDLTLNVKVTALGFKLGEQDFPVPDVIKNGYILALPKFGSDSIGWVTGQLAFKVLDQ